MDYIEEERFMRTSALLGRDAVLKLTKSRVTVVGLGGVGGHIAETLARAGVGSLYLIDFDKVEKSNVNRQIIALESTIGKDKTECFRARLREINPNISIQTSQAFVDETNVADLGLEETDYIADAVDAVSAKVALIRQAKRLNVPIVSCMGTGNKLDPMRLKIADISKTSVCPLARAVRKKLNEQGLRDVKVLYSDEPPALKSRTPASVPFVPSVAGILIAREIILDIVSVPCKNEEK